MASVRWISISASAIALSGCGLLLDLEAPATDGGALDASFDVSTGPECTADAQCGDCATCGEGRCVPVDAGMPCRDAVGECDAAEACDGTALECPPDARLDTDVTCRPAAGACDEPETCNGVAADCPADAFVSFGTPCPDGTVCPGSGPDCVACGEPCTSEDFPCEEGLVDCSAREPSCAPTGVALPAGAPCRAAVGPCDHEETCDGVATGCPADDYHDASVICRARTDECDPPEWCTGASTDCPADVAAPSGVPCRGARGPCDLGEECDGSSTACPPDGFRSAGYMCRLMRGECDVTEVCDGTGATCPPDAVSPPGVACSRGTCDGVSPACGRMPITGGCARRAGSCMRDFDCFTSGCSSEMCATTALSTICDCPSPSGITCGCVAGSCSWYR